ncbi:transporter substrate-binding domain-containing protein [Zavarzinia aquatilis]|uniref:Histidine kinase n=1 Tax=Zavarzinia aquatilis TaxID=2211142 RepID=A0A317E5L4_9PROT|nr:transporter substrate-binding domain-containing protein [Zavarzinia aquatilis]PWR21480.1 histidine kinase [Zavarzinia aquatilis]
MSRVPGFFSLCGLALAVFLLRAAPAAADLTLRFAPEKDYGPFVYQDASGQIMGLSVDILRGVAEAGGIVLDTLPARSLSEILDAVKAGEVDLVSSLRPNPERGAFLDFSQAYVAVPAILIERAGGERHTLDEMAGRRVAVGKGYAVEAFVRDNYPAVEWVALPDDGQGLQALADGQVDGVVADAASVAFVRARKRLPALTNGSPVGFDYALSFAYPKGREDIGAALDKGLRALTTDRRHAILDRWIPPTVEPAADQRKATVGWIAAVAAAFAVLVALFATIRRMRHVRAR